MDISTALANAINNEQVINHIFALGALILGLGVAIFTLYVLRSLFEKGTNPNHNDPDGF